MACPPTAADFGRKTPDAAAADSELGQFFFAELQNAVRRVRADRVNGVGRLLFQPLKTIRMFDSVHSIVQTKFQLYNTNLIGTTKLRDGSVYFDPGAINHKRWRQRRRADAPPPAFSIFRH